MRFFILAFALVGACDQITGTAPRAKSMCSGLARADTSIQHYYLTPAGDTVLIGPANTAAGGWWQTVIVETPCAGR